MNALGFGFDFRLNFDLFINNVIDYFIDASIIIKENDSTIIQMQNFMLKYKRIIASVLLVILVLIGWHCDLFINSNQTQNDSNKQNKSTNNKNVKTIQKGGDNANPKPDDAPLKPDALKPDAPPLPPPPKIPLTGMAASGKAKVKAMQSAATTAKMKTLGGLKSAVSYDTYANMANKFAGSSDIIYRILYSIAIFIMICIIVVPSLAFIIIGVICFFLLKDRMKGIKGL